MSAQYKYLASPTSFISRYMEYMDGNETPYSFDFWSAMFLVSCVLRRRCCVARPGAPVWLNHYILLVAPPGVARKSTAVNIAAEHAQWITAQTGSNGMIYSGSLTPTMLLNEMRIMSQLGVSSPVLLTLPELSRSFARNAAKSTIAFLTDMFDTKEYEKGGTKREGTYEVRKASISILAASTPDWLGQFGSRDAAVGGFTSRCIVLREDGPKRHIKWREASTQPDHSLLRSALLDIDRRLSHLEQAHGGVEYGLQVTSAAIDAYEGYVESLRAHIRTLSEEEAAKRVRDERHILAVAGTLACADLTFEVQQNHIINAIKAIELVRRSDAKQSEAEPLRSDNSPQAEPINEAQLLRGRIFDRLSRILKEAGKLGIQQQTIAKKVRYLCTMNDAKLALRIMHDWKCAQMFRVHEAGRPSQVWRATYLIDSPAFEHARKLFVGEPMTTIDLDQAVPEDDQSSPPYH